MKTILITGAASGIGKATAQYFAKNQWNVVATMLSLSEADDLLTTPNVFCYEMDVTNTESINNAKTKILNDFGTIDVVINNAGIGYRSFIELSQDANIEAITSVNWIGVVKVCRAFIPVFRNQNHGQFINISSIAGLVNLPLGNFYHATKQAVESFSECMAYELLDFNISVATVQFGNAPTNFQKNVTKSQHTDIPSYNNLMEKISAVLIKKSNKNKDLTAQITATLLSIANAPQKKFKRYTIGFDANAMKLLRSILGYRLFNALIRYSVMK